MSMTEEEFWAILYDVPTPKPIFYRLYYNDDDTPRIYSMEDLPGKYIDVDPKTFAVAPYNVKVVNGKLVEIVPKSYSRKLIPGDGTPCHIGDVSIVVSSQEPHTSWGIKEYETN